MKQNNLVVYSLHKINSRFYFTEVGDHQDIYGRNYLLNNLQLLTLLRCAY